MRCTTPSTLKIAETWPLTVFSCMPSARAITLLAWPRHSCSSTSRWRAVRPLGSGAVVSATAAPARAMKGGTYSSPASTNLKAATKVAGGLDLGQ